MTPFTPHLHLTSGAAAPRAGARDTVCTGGPASRARSLRTDCHVAVRARRQRRSVNHYQYAVYYCARPGCHPSSIRWQQE